LVEQQQCLVATSMIGGWVLQRSQGMGEQQRWCTADGVDARDRAVSDSSDSCTAHHVQRDRQTQLSSARL
jgi:hypothetical protein